MNPSSRDQPERSHVGPRSTGGMASKVNTPATPGFGEGSAAATTKPKVMDAAGAVGKQFTPEGAIGGAAQAIGGPLDKDGVVGKQFTEQGSIGGTVQGDLGGMKGGSA